MIGQILSKRSSKGCDLLQNINNIKTITVLETTFSSWNCFQLFQRIWNLLETQTCKQLCQNDRIDTAVAFNRSLCLVIGEFLKAKTPIFFKIVFFTNFQTILAFIWNNWQVMKYLVPLPSCFGDAEFRTRLKLILHNNACAENRDTKKKNKNKRLYKMRNSAGFAILQKPAYKNLDIFS